MPITAQEIEKLLAGLTSKSKMLALLATPGQVVSKVVVNDILQNDPSTAAVLERLINDRICTAQTNRWWPSQYRALNTAIASPEFDAIRPTVRSRNTGAEIYLSDPKTGNVVIIEIAAPDAKSVMIAAKSAKNEMAKSKKATINRIRAERSTNSM